MNIILLIPTGIGCEIGGHAGDAGPVAKLLAKTCDNLILHPNVVNASDINEMPENSLYITGATIDDLLAGYVGIRKVRRNRIAVLVNKPVSNELINVVSAARASAGISAFIVELPDRLRMIAGFNNDGSATGVIEGAQEAAEFLLNKVEKEFDAVAIITQIEMEENIAKEYIEKKGVNPWGGVEAKLTRILTDILKVPCAHSPFGHTLDNYNDIVDPRIAAEMVSVTYSFCVLKGLHKAPEIVDRNDGLCVDYIDAMISPINCYGEAHRLCLENQIPIIVVEENDPIIKNNKKFDSFKVKNYMEAAGLIIAIKEGISFESLGRPIHPTEIIRNLE